MTERLRRVQVFLSGQEIRRSYWLFGLQFILGQWFWTQVSESYQQKNSLFNAMSRFIGAVNNMDQTVMLPNLLRDFPPEDSGDLRATPTGAGSSGGGYLQPNMYGSYVLLKSIRHDIEWGVVQDGMEDVRAAEWEDDLQKELHFHLNGLHAVLAKLTHKANTLTSRYKEGIGCSN